LITVMTVVHMSELCWVCFSCTFRSRCRPSIARSVPVSWLCVALQQTC